MVDIVALYYYIDLICNSNDRQTPVTLKKLLNTMNFVISEWSASIALILDVLLSLLELTPS